jgi:hypothetical protein
MSDDKELHKKYVSMYPNDLRIDTVYHEKRKTQIIYNKKYKKLVERCKKKAENHKLFGKLMGYATQINLARMNYTKHVLDVRYLLDDITFLGYWKPMNENFENEYKLWLKMCEINPKIVLRARIVSP